MKSEIQRLFSSKIVRWLIVIILVIAIAWLLGQMAVPALMKALFLGKV